MSSPFPRSLSARLAVLAGLSAFAIGMFANAVLIADPRAEAQDDCTQPSDSGCPMGMNTPFQAALTDPSTQHTWLLDVADTTDFTVTLTNLAGDYELTVYGPDGSLYGSSDNGGTQDEVVPVTNLGVGTYTVVVDSLSGDSSDTPYTVIATQAAPPTPITFTTYGTPVPKSFSSYR
ncbi:MAG TPA: PPC domain-containing protein [Chloroflexota bacterium]|nr:PPC domain-containing protein [Chloroflexota bacterium]